MKKLIMPKFLIKLMIISIFAGIIPIVSFGIYSNYYFSNNVQNKVDQLSLQNLTETVVRIEQLLTTIDHSLTLMANSSALNSTYEADYDSRHFQAFHALSTQLLQMQSLNMGIRNVFFVNWDRQWVLENRGVAVMETHPWHKQFEDFMAMERNSAWVAAADPIMEDAGNSDTAAGRLPDVSSYFLYKKTPINAPEPNGLLVVQIPRYELERRINLSGSDHVQLVTDKTFNLLVSSGQALFPDSRLPAALIDSVKAADAAAGAKLQINSKYYAIVKQSSYNDWYYFSIYPSEQITKDVTQIRRITVALSGALMLITLAASLLLNRKAYQPIRRLYEKVALHSGSDKKSYDEIRFIGERIETLIDTSGNLNRQLVGQEQKLQGLYMFKLLIGEADPAEVEQNLAHFGVRSSAGHIAVITAQIGNWGQTRYSDSDLDIMMFAVNNVISELIPEDLRMDPVIIGACHATIVRGNQTSEAEFRLYLASLSQLIQGAIKQYLKLNVHIGISRSHRHMGEVPLAYREALEALKGRYLMDGESLLFYDDLFSDKSAAFVYPKKAEKDLIYALYESNVPAAKETFHGISRYFIAQNITFRECQLYLNRLLVNVIAESLHPGESLQLLLKDNKTIFEQLFELNSIGEIESWFEERVILPLIRSRLNGMYQNQYNKIADQMIAIIHEQYKTDLTLEQCAEQLNFNPDYLRRAFRKGVGMNFSDYLAQYRFEASKQLLANSDLTIADISQQLNYNNSQNFIRYFKKMMGMTPGQYREKIKKS